MLRITNICYSIRNMIKVRLHRLQRFHSVPLTHTKSQVSHLSYVFTFGGARKRGVCEHRVAKTPAPWGSTAPTLLLTRLWDLPPAWGEICARHSQTAELKRYRLPTLTLRELHQIRVIVLAG